MIWFLFIPLQLTMAYAGYRHAKSDGTWSWWLFLFVIGFLLMETCLVSVPPIKLLDPRSPYLVPVWTAAWIIATLNFIWFLKICRGWKFNPPPAKTPRPRQSQPESPCSNSSNF